MYAGNQATADKPHQKFVTCIRGRYSRYILSGIIIELQLSKNNSAYDDLGPRLELLYLLQTRTKF